LGGVQIDTRRIAPVADDEHAHRHHAHRSAHAGDEDHRDAEGASISAQTWSPSGSQVAHRELRRRIAHLRRRRREWRIVQVTKTPLLAARDWNDWTPDGRASGGSWFPRDWACTDARQELASKTDRLFDSPSRARFAGHSSEPARGSARQGCSSTTTGQPAR
jgi:hypothetical protein